MLRLVLLLVGTWKVELTDNFGLVAVCATWTSRALDAVPDDEERKSSVCVTV